MRRAAKVDANQAELVALMRRLGMSVAITSSSHDGFPDLVVGYGGVTVLVEVKDGSKWPSARQLTPAQKQFHGAFKGAITTIETAEQATSLVNTIRKAAASLSGINWKLGAVADAKQQGA